MFRIADYEKAFGKQEEEKTSSCSTPNSDTEEAADIPTQTQALVEVMQPANNFLTTLPPEALIMISELLSPGFSVRFGLTCKAHYLAHRKVYGTVSLHTHSSPCSSIALGTYLARDWLPKTLGFNYKIGKFVPKGELEVLQAEWRYAREYWGGCEYYHWDEDEEAGGNPDGRYYWDGSRMVPY